MYVCDIDVVYSVNDSNVYKYIILLNRYKTDDFRISLINFLN